jgi:hypothetical protein
MKRQKHLRVDMKHLRITTATNLRQRKDPFRLVNVKEHFNLPRILQLRFIANVKQ